MQGRGKKTNYDKNARANEEFQKGKKFGRPKQRWAEASINGKAIPMNLGTSELENRITEATIGSYVPAHWEKV